MTQKNTQLTLSEVKGPLNQINEMLSGPFGRRNLVLLNKFLRKEPVWENRKKVWIIWKKISYDTSETSKLYNLNDSIFHDRETKLIIGKAELFQVPSYMELVLVLPEEIGLTGQEAFSIAEVYAHAEEHGLRTIPLTYTLQLRNEYSNQPVDERVICATEPQWSIESDSQKKLLATLYTDSEGSKIGMFAGDWEAEYPCKTKFVFAIEKK